MNKTRKFFLKQFVILFILVLLSSFFKIAEPWKIYLWIWIAIALSIITVPVLGKPLHALWLWYLKITNEAMRFFQGFGIVLILIFVYLLIHGVFMGNAHELNAFLSSGKPENIPPGKYLYWGTIGSLLLVTGLNSYTAKMLYKVWMAFASALQAVTSRIILFLVFILAVLPVGLIAKLVRKKFLDKTFQDETRPSYWLNREQEFNAKSYRRHF